MARGDLISQGELPDAIRGLEGEMGEAEIDLSPGRSLKEVERDMILRTLEDTGGNRTRTAEILGISRRTLQLKLKEYGVN
jgi:two-component system response regulator HydG